MRKKKKQNKITIDETKLVAVVPGMLISAKTLIELGNSYDMKNNVVFGNMISTTMIIAQCLELLLKYKIQQEGKDIEKDHNLHKLFKTLKDESKVEIQNIFKEETSIMTLPDGWDSVESIFQKAQNAFVHWRYVVSSPQRTETIYPAPLYMAAVSVYKSTPISRLGVDIKEVSDPTIKARVKAILSGKSPNR